MGVSVAVVRILDTNPVPVPKRSKLEPARPARAEGRTRIVKAGGKRAAAGKTKKG
jgi:hypothetical protein